MNAEEAAGQEWPEIHRERRAFTIVDIVDSVALIERHESDVVERWRRFLNEVDKSVLPALGGTMVKSLGDGMLLSFREGRQAVAAALEIQARIGAYNTGRPPDAHIRVRAATHVAEVVADERDLLGRGVNLAARLATLAGPGEIVVSADVRDELLGADDTRIEDMGECELRGIARPTRAYRVWAGADEVRPIPMGHDTLADARPTLAVLPLSAGMAGPEAATLAELAFDQLLQALSRSPHWRVISRLSMAAYRHRTPTLAALKQRLQADYVVSGKVFALGARLRASVELADAKTGTIVWAGDEAGRQEDLFEAHCPPIHELAAKIGSAIVAHEIERSRSSPLPTLRSYALLFGGVALMHRLSRADFDRSAQLLGTLVERHPQAPEPSAWLGKWHVMRVAQGWSADAQADARMARQLTQRALDKQSDHALALAIDGLAAAFLLADLDTSEQRYAAAIEANPNEALAWLFLSALHTYRDRDAEAVQAAAMALRLSPLDPLRYFFDAFAANAMTAAGRYDEAIELARRSIRANCTHMPTHRALAIAQVLSGRGAEALATVQRLLKVQPGYSVHEFEQRYSGRGSRHAEVYAKALREAGLPER